jgi:hypothetical protein
MQFSYYMLVPRTLIVHDTRAEYLFVIFLSFTAQLHEVRYIFANSDTELVLGELISSWSSSYLRI